MILSTLLDNTHTDHVEPAPTTRIVLFVGALSLREQVTSGNPENNPRNRLPRILRGRQTRRSMNLSLKEVADRKAALENEAKQIWFAFASRLAESIPESCRAFANEKGWYKSESDGFWNLPEFLEQMIHITKFGGGINDKYHKIDLETYGFGSFEDLEIKLKELEQAWANEVRIEICKNDGYRIEVRYYASEFEPKQIELTA